MSPTAPRSDLFRLDGKVAIVTGGGRGIGRAIAQSLAEHGATVVIAGRDEATLAKALPELTAVSPRSAFHTLDVTREDSVAALEAWVTARFGFAEILVNNAGINPFYRAAEHVTLGEWQQLIEVNLTGVFLCCRAFGVHMLANGAGSIINVTSVAGHVGLQKTTAYCAAKGGVEMMTRSLALDWSPKGVRVNTLAPGYVETDLTAGMRDHPVLADRLRAKTPMGRFAAPSELAGAAVFLASPASSYMTGQSVVVDGGWTAA
jgi:NAD(P)-dependent dehydrogenase (short-subunit alcohol dehydrogenase family)